MDEELVPDLEPFLWSDLPPLPDVLAEGDVVPVARWIGTELAAVRVVTQDGDDVLRDDVFVFRRGEAPNDRWLELSGSGGSEWPATVGRWLQLEPPAPTVVQWEGLLVLSEGPLGAAAMSGRAGQAAVAIALIQRARLVEAITSPVGVFVVAFDPDREWRIEVLTRDGVVLADLSGPA